MSRSPGPLTDSDYSALGALRFQIRKFLHFSEEAARSEGLEPQQHQALLAVRSRAGSGGPTISELAQNLLIRHHSAVGLIDRLAEHGLVERQRGDSDRRHVRIHLTPKGEATLHRLAGAHRDELQRTGPLLLEALTALISPAPKLSGEECFRDSDPRSAE